MRVLRHKAPSAATCAAVLKRIHSPILRNQADHRKPLYGDHEIRFQLIAGDNDGHLAATGFPPVVE